MSFRFRKSFKVAPGVRLNVGKRGGSVRVGGKGFGATAGTSGSRVTAGIPGSGLSYSKQIGSGARGGSETAAAIIAVVVGIGFVVALVILATVIF